MSSQREESTNIYTTTSLDGSVWEYYNHVDVVNDQTGSVAQDMTVANDLNYVISAIIGPALCILGMAGNGLSILVWSRPGMKSSTARYLTGQACADFWLLVFFMACDSVQAWAPGVKYSYSYGIFFSYFGYPMFYITAVLSVWITVGVTADRYIMVCWITKAKRLCSATRAKLGLGLTTVCVCLINVPNFVFYTPVAPTTGGDDTFRNEHSGNSSSSDGYMQPMSFKLSDFGGSPRGFFYEFWVHCIVVLLVPWLSVMLMNAMIIKGIVDANKRMQDKKTAGSMEKSKRSENQITRLLLAVTFSFLLFMGFQCVVQCFWMQKPPQADWAVISSTYAFGKVGIVMTSSLNFVFYCLMGRRFRTELGKLFGLHRKNVNFSSLMEHPSVSTTHSTSLMEHPSVSTTHSTSTTGM